jgi:hypothetical protein
MQGWAIKKLFLGFFILALLEASAIWANPDPATQLAASCSSCHDTDAELNFLSASFTNGADLVEDTTYRLRVTIPAQTDQFRIDIQVDELIDGVSADDNQGDFVVASDNASLLTDIAYNGGGPAAITRRVGASAFRGNLATTFQAGQSTTQDFFWRSPALDVLPDGVRFKVWVVEGASQGDLKSYSTQTITLGVTSGPDDDDDDDSGNPTDDSAQDADGNSSGGSYGGSFGCARIETAGENPPLENALDFGFLFLLFLSFVAALRGAKPAKSLAKDPVQD